MKDRVFGSRLRLPALWRGLGSMVVLIAAAMVVAAACGAEPVQGPPTDPQQTPGLEPTPFPDLAPDFELTLYGNENHEKGEVFRLSDVGGPAVVNFWFPSCPPCVAEMPDLDAAFKAHKSDGIAFVGVQLLGLDTADDGQAFIDDNGITYAVGADEGGEILTSFKITGFPSTVFIDKDRRIVRKWTGFLDSEKIEELIQEMLEGAPG